jgi:mercuric ion transport protein
MSLPYRPRNPPGDLAFGWTALGAGALAVLAWAACCVLPIALSLAGLSLAGTAVIAGQRTWLTLGAGIVLAAGWWMVWRRHWACAVDATCAPPSRWTISLLAAATLLTGLALAWQTLIEPYLLDLLRMAR